MKSQSLSGPVSLGYDLQKSFLVLPTLPSSLPLPPPWRALVAGVREMFIVQAGLDAGKVFPLGEQAFVTKLLGVCPLVILTLPLPGPWGAHLYWLFTVRTWRGS